MRAIREIRIGGEGSDLKNGEGKQVSATYHRAVSVPAELPLWAQVANLVARYGREAVVAALGVDK